MCHRTRHWSHAGGVWLIVARHVSVGCVGCCMCVAARSAYSPVRWACQNGETLSMVVRAWARWRSGGMCVPSFAQNSRGRRKSFEACLADAGAERRCPVLGPKACCSCPLFYRCEGLWARGGSYLRRLVGGRSTGRCLRGIHPIVPVSSLFLLERMKQWPRAPHTREGKSDGPV